MTDEALHHSGLERWIIAFSVMCATFMEVLDTTVVNVSLPHIAGSLSASIDESTWVLTSYLVSNAIILPLAGWLASQFGRKRLLLTAVTGFTLSSLLCGIAPNLPSLIIFRVLQGVSGGCLQPMSQAVMLETFPARDRGKAMAFWGLGIVVAPILGPVLGGWLTDSYSWRWVFYVNLPVGLLALVMIEEFVFDPSYIRRADRSVDYWGIGMLALGVGALQILLDKGQEDDWFASVHMRWFAGVAAVMLVAFVIHELRASNPVIDLRVFRHRTYSACVFLITTVGFVLFGSLVLLPIMLQTLFGYPSLQAGIAMAPRGLGSFVFMPVTGILVGRADPRRLVAAGAVLGSVSLFWLGTLDLNAGMWDIFWPQVIQGVGLSLVFVPLSTIAMDPIPRDQFGNATSLFSLMRNIGGSFGIATTGTLLVRHRQEYLNTLGAHVTPYDTAVRALVDGSTRRFELLGLDPVTAAQRAYGSIWGLVNQQAAMLSFVHLFALLGLMFLVILPLTLLMKRPATAGRPHAAE